MEGKQNFYLFLGMCIFASVIYFSSIERSISSFVDYDLKLRVKMPNFVFILTDDQDSMMGSMKAMKNVHHLLIKNGASFRNAFAASPLCCPSRSSILTGQYVHNHKAINNSLSGGCSNKAWQKGPEKRSFATTLKANNYNTFFAGKYLNQYGIGSDGLSHVPPGWNWWIGLQGNSKYYNYSVSVNGTKETHKDDPDADYFTNVIRARSLEFLHSLPDNQIDSDPFFMMVSTPACHAPFEPEPKYAKKFPEEKVPRTPNFNVANDDTKHWLLRLGEQPLSEEHISQVDEIYRKRLRTLLTVDDLVGDIYSVLVKKSLLDNTYIIFTSDHGYHLGQFSLPLDKREPYEFDIRVPLVISGPGISRSIINFPSTNIDLAPTFLDIAGIKIPKIYDGLSLKSLLMRDSSHNKLTKPLEGNTYKLNNKFSPRRTLLVEHSGEYVTESRGCEYLGPNLHGCVSSLGCKCEDSKNNTYACLRHLSAEREFTYCAWQDDENFEEYYNLKKDKYQLNNTVTMLPLEILKKLRTFLKNYKKCRSTRCSKLSKFVI